MIYIRLRVLEIAEFDFISLPFPFLSSPSPSPSLSLPPLAFPLYLQGDNTKVAVRPGPSYEHWVQGSFVYSVLPYLRYTIWLRATV